MAGGTLWRRSERSVAPWSRVATAVVVVYAAVDVILASFEPQYSLLRDAQSDYGLGQFSWLMDCNFLVRAGLSLTLAAALARACQRSTDRPVGPLVAGA